MSKCRKKRFLYIFRSAIIILVILGVSILGHVDQLFMVQKAMAATAEYYVDFDNGSNANSGLDAAHPKKTHPYDKISSWTPTVTGTTYIYLKKGVIYRGILDINDKNGFDSTHRIITTFKEGFGTGNPPEIRGSSLYNNNDWTQDGTYTNTYSKSFGTTKILFNYNRNFGVWEDDTMIIGVDTLDNCNKTPGSFFLDTTINELYIHTYETDDPDSHSTEVSTTFGQSISISGIFLRVTSGTTSNFTFKGITISRFRDAGIYVNSSTVSNVNFENLVIKDNDMGIYSQGTSGMEYDNLTIIRNLNRGFYHIGGLATLQNSIVAANALNGFGKGIERSAGTLSLKSNNSSGNGNDPNDNYVGTYTDLGGNISKTPQFKDDYRNYSKFSFGIDDAGNAAYAKNLAEIYDNIKAGPQNAPLTLFFSGVSAGDVADALYAQNNYGMEIGNHTKDHVLLEINDSNASVEFYYSGANATATAEVTSGGVLKLTDSTTGSYTLSAYLSLAELKASVLRRSGWAMRYSQYGDKRNATDLLTTAPLSCKSTWGKVNATVDQKITLTYTGANPTATVEVTSTQIIFVDSTTRTYNLSTTRRLDEFTAYDLPAGWAINRYGFDIGTPTKIFEVLAQTNAKNVQVNMPTSIDNYYGLEVGAQGQYLQSQFGQQPVSLAYPNGDYRQDSDQLLAAQGIQSARTVDMAFNLQNALLNKTDLYYLSNLNIGDSPVTSADGAQKWGYQIATILNLYPIYLSGHWYDEANVDLNYAGDIYQTIIDNTGATVDTQGNSVTAIKAAGTASSDGLRYSQKISSDLLNLEPTNLSPEVDAGADLSQTSDIYGNNIYGTPDIGAIEYQPEYTIGVDPVNVTGNIRVYEDGKYRYTNATSGSTTASFDITPSDGFPAANYAQWMDVSIDTWNLSGNYYRKWLETAGSGVISDHRIDGLRANGSYLVKVDSVAIGTYQQADSGGVLTFVYDGGYSTKTFELIEDSTAPVTTLTASPSSPDGSNGWYMSAPTITLSATDSDSGSGVAHTYYRWGSDSYAVYSSALTATEGDNILSYYSVDNAGNIETTHTAEFKTDLSLPVIHLTSPHDKEIFPTNAVVIAGTANDAVSGLASLTVNGVPMSNSANFSTTVALSEGENILIVVATDLAGNHLQQIINVTYQKENNPAAEAVLSTMPTYFQFFNPITIFILLTNGEKMPLYENTTLQLSTQTPNFVGTAYPNVTIDLTLMSNPIIATLKTDSGGNWSYQTTAVLDYGPHKLQTIFKDQSGKLLASKTYNFVITEPTAQTNNANKTTTATKFSSKKLWLYLCLGIFVILIGILVVRKRKTA